MRHGNEEEAKMNATKRNFFTKGEFKSKMERQSFKNGNENASTNPSLKLEKIRLLMHKISCSL